jgi:hypothetical protein
MRFLPKVFIFCSLSVAFFLLSTDFATSVNAQTTNLDQYCEEIKNDAPLKKAPNDFPPPFFDEPKWEELDNTSFKTTVSDLFTLTDTPIEGSGAYGGALSISNLSLPNAKEVSDYLEGRFLDEDHRLADLRKLTSAGNLDYYGRIAKLTPQKVQDRLKAGYVYALVELGKDDGTYKIPDISFLYADVCGNNQRTIYDLVQNWGMPEVTLPTLKENPTQADFDRWRHTWGKYWPKIPLHDPGGAISCDLNDPACQQKFPEGVFGQPPNMRSAGCLVFRRGEATRSTNRDCPPPQPPQIQVVRLGLPDLFRLDTLARFTQQLLLPQRLLKSYFCKFRGLGNFCEKNQKVNIGNCGLPQGNTEASRLGECGPADGEPGVGGNPIYIYDENGNKVESATIHLTGGPPNSPPEEIRIESKFPYLGITWGKLIQEITGTFRFFDPQNRYLSDPKYWYNSTKIPATISFVDTTCNPDNPATCQGSVSEPKIWAGFLSGIKKSKNFVICSLLPSPFDTAACAAQAGI